MKIVFMGTPDFAVPSLDILCRNGLTIAAVVTGEDKPRGRGQTVSFTPVKEYAVAHNLRLLQPASLREAGFIETLRGLHADLFVVVAFRILPNEVYTIPTRGSYNLHASLLPKYRGAAPINWAIINGEKESGVTTFFLADSVDTGKIILQKKIPLGDTMTAGELHDRLAVVGADAVLETVRLIEAGNPTMIPQNNQLATPAPKIFKDDCRIVWNQPAAILLNFIRGLSPSPGAWAILRESIVKIYISAKAEGVKIRRINLPGTLALEGERLYVECTDGLLEILEVQQQGKKRMTGKEFARGFRFKEGERFI
jgi:methionyl-tRNA formyltransferase